MFQGNVSYSLRFVQRFRNEDGCRLGLETGLLRAALKANHRLLYSLCLSEVENNERLQKALVQLMRGIRSSAMIIPDSHVTSDTQSQTMRGDCSR